MAELVDLVAPGLLGELALRWPVLLDGILAPALFTALALVLARRRGPADGQLLLLAALAASALQPPLAALARGLDWGLFRRPLLATSGDLPPELFGMDSATVTSGADPGAWLLLAWCAGSCVLLVRLVRAHRAARRRLSDLPAAVLPDALSEELDLACEQAGVQRPRVLLDDSTHAPRVFGLGCRVLVLCPRFASLEPDQRRAVLAHELAHLARRDAWSHLVVELVRALLWVHPLVALAAREHDRRCELACDAWVLARGIDRERYARTLLALAPARAVPLAPALAGSTFLRRRLEFLLAPTVPAPRAARRWMAAAMLAVLLAPTGLALLRERSPRAQPGVPRPLEEIRALLDESVPALGEEVRVHPARLDLGLAPAGDQRRGSLWIVNAGPRPRRLLRARPTCGCVTLAALEDVELAPGQAVELPLTMLATAAPGERTTKRVQVLVEGLPLLEAEVALGTSAADGEDRADPR